MTKNSCPLCQSQSLLEFLRRENIPVHQNMICRDQQSAVAIQRGDLVMIVCNQCGFVFNAAFDDSKMSYDASYENTQFASAVVQAHAEQLVQHLVGSASYQ
jgi:hypothetical protein